MEALDIFITVTAGVILIAIILMSYYLLKLAIFRGQPRPFIGSPEPDAIPGMPESDARRRERENQEWLEGVESEDLFIDSDDGLRLHAIFLPGRREDRAFILAHGYDGNARQMLGFARYFYDTYGYTILVPDTRAHGESQGKYIGMGWPDRLDYIKWTKYLIDRLGGDIKVALYGVSMGGATVSMMSGEQSLPDQIAFIVEDCGYTSAFDEFRYQLKRIFNIPKFPIMYIANSMAEILAKYSFKQASALKQVAATDRPMIFIHGEDDDFVPFEMAGRLFEACSSPDKTLITVPGAGHAEATVKDVDGAINAAIDEYIKKYM